jgi:hypothetical protein
MAIKEALAVRSISILIRTVLRSLLENLHVHTIMLLFPGSLKYRALFPKKIPRTSIQIMKRDCRRSLLKKSSRNLMIISKTLLLEMGSYTSRKSFQNLQAVKKSIRYWRKLRLQLPGAGS